MAMGRDPESTATIFESRLLQSSEEGGERAGYDGHKHKRGSKGRLAVDTLDELLALYIPPANTQGLDAVAALAACV